VTGNHVIDALSRPQQARMAALCEPVLLLAGASVPARRSAEAYFPTGCVLALVAAVGEGRELQVGMVGLDQVLSVDRETFGAGSQVRAMVQVGGMALRLNQAKLRQELADTLQWRHVLRRERAERASQAISIAACSRFHSVSQRLGRFLLASAQCAGCTTLTMTHDTMALMLGVRRSGVTEAAARMQRQGMIRYSRGNVELLALDALGRSACSCQRQDRRSARQG
jgi:hypothetical protein